MPAHRDVGFTRSASIELFDWTRTPATRIQNHHRPTFLHSQESDQSTLPYKITQEPILYNLRSSKEYKMSQHHINDNINSFNTNISFNNVSNNYTATGEKPEILAWISPLESQRRHHDVRARRVGKVGDWLLQTEEYREWFGGIRGGKSGNSALFGYGGPGVGKTYIR